jgi:hypothetical protein
VGATYSVPPSLLAPAGNGRLYCATRASLGELVEALGESIMISDIPDESLDATDIIAVHRAMIDQTPGEPGFPAPPGRPQRSPPAEGAGMADRSVSGPTSPPVPGSPMP